MSKASIRKELFKKQVDPNGSSTYSVESFIDAMDVASKFAANHGVSKKDFWEEDNVKTLNAHIQRLSAMKLFRLTHPDVIKIISKYFGLYKRYLSSDAIEAEKAAMQQRDNTPLDNKSDELIVDNTIYDYDFNAVPSLRFTKPVSANYFDEKFVETDSWPVVYSSILKCLYEDYPDQLDSLKDKTIESAGGVILKGNIPSEMFSKSVRISYGLYASIAQVPRDFMVDIKALLDICNIDYENVEIKYKKIETPFQNEDSVSASVAPAETPAVDIPETKPEIISEPVTFNASKSTDEQKHANRVYFNTNYEFRYTEPTSLTYKGKLYTDIISSWISLYKCILSNLVKDYPSVFVNGTELLSGGCIDIANAANKDRMRKPQLFANGLYCEANISAIDTVRRIASAARMVGLTDNDIVITYVSKKDATDNTQSPPKNLLKEFNAMVNFVTKRFSVRCHNIVDNEILYKAKNSTKDVLWLYYCKDKNGESYISIETEPQFVTGLDLSAFDNVINRQRYPELKLVFYDFEKIKQTLSSICDSIDSFFSYGTPLAGRKPIIAPQVKVNRDAEIEKQSPLVYSKLFSVSKIYDNPEGITTDQIFKLIGHFCSETRLIEILDSVSWARKVSDKKYTFSKKVIDSPYIEEPVVNYNPFIIEEAQPDFDKEEYTEVLLNRFRGGMQFDSIDFDIFRDCYDSLFDKKLDCNDETLEKQLRQCGVYYNDRLFPADGIIDKATGEKLLSYIENAFASGKTVIYYKAIMTDMADDFAYCFSLTDEKMLRAYIEYSVPKKTYFFSKDYMSDKRFVKIDHAAEIADYMLSVGKPLSYEEIYAELSHIASDVIRSEIHTNKMFVMDSKEHYFHIDIFECDDSELDKISEIVNSVIEENGYAIWGNIYGQIQDRMPVFIENNPYLGSLGIRNALSRKLYNKFNFDGAIVSTVSEQLSMADVYRLYAKHHPTFTDNDIYNFSKELDTVIYFDALYEVCVRVSEHLFVSREDINIDVDAVDAAIGTYFSGKYMLIKDIDSFLVFPNVGYEWNQFLLECFLNSYSKKYKLLNNGYSFYNVAGAVIKRNSEELLFVDICADVLANSDITLNKANALDYLVEMNLITRRSYREIDRAITLANQTRNRKG